MNDEKYNTVSFFGYIRGTYLDKHQRIHVNGLGDYEIKSIQRVDDPCPIELKKTVKQKQAEHAQNDLATAAKKKKRNLKDKEKIIYAPFSNIGAVNFENSTGYITIPDKYVVYTKFGEDDAQLGGVDNTDKGNEGQELVWGLQGMTTAMNENKIQAPQLLSGINIDSDAEEDWKPKDKSEKLKVTVQNQMVDKFAEQRSQDKQSLYREKEVQNLSDLIYKEIDREDQANQESEFIVDSNRYEVNEVKLLRYKISDVKKLLKRKFVTGQSQDQIMKNLLDMSDSDEEEKAEMKKLKNKAKRGQKVEESKEESESDDDNDGDD